MLFFTIPLAITILRGFGLFSVTGSGGFTFQYYVDFLTRAIYRKSLLFTFYIGLASAAVSLFFAIPLSAFLSGSVPFKPVISVLYKAPIIIPSLIATFMIMTVIAPQGLLNSVLINLGLISQPLQLVQDRWGIGIIIVQSWKNVPFMTVIISAVMLSINPDLIEAARNLGANRLQVLWHVMIPLSMPGISAAFLLVFIKAYGGFMIPALIGPVFLPTIPVLMQTEAMRFFHWETASVLATVITLSAVVVLLFYYRLIGEEAERVLGR